MDGINFIFISFISFHIYILSKLNNKLRFLYRKQKYLDKETRILLCNSLIQPHYDFACTSWFPLLTKDMKKRFQISQNKLIQFCLNLGSRESINLTRFREINWLPVKERVNQCIYSLVYKFLNNNEPDYIGDILNIKEKNITREIPTC